MSKQWEPIDFTVYFSFIKWKVLFFAIVEIFLRVQLGALEKGLLMENSETIIWVFRVLVFLYIGWQAVRHFGGVTAVGAIAGALSGFTVGLVVSIYRIVTGPAIWKFFNIIVETTMMMIVGSVIAVLVVYIFRSKYKVEKINN